MTDVVTLKNRATQTPDAHAETRNFGLVVGGVFALLGFWWLHRDKHLVLAPWFAGLGVLLVILGLVAPKLLSGPFRLWMALAELMSAVMTRLILFIVFFLVITPIGVIRRIAGSDPLRRRSAPLPSYWEQYTSRQKDVRHYEKMF